MCIIYIYVYSKYYISILYIHIIHIFPYKPSSYWGTPMTMETSVSISSLQVFSALQARRGEPQEPQRRGLSRAAALVDLHGATPGANHGEGGSPGSPVGGGSWKGGWEPWW